MFRVSQAAGSRPNYRLAGTRIQRTLRPGFRRRIAGQVRIVFESVRECLADEITTPIQGGFKMLVLTRKLREAVRIGDNVRVTIVRTGVGAVRIGVEAPDGMKIVREEIESRIADGESIADLRDEFDHREVAGT
jgi:carbon storage regulator